MTGVFFRPLLAIIVLPIVWLIAREILRVIPAGRVRRILTFRLW